MVTLSSPLDCSSTFLAHFAITLCWVCLVGIKCDIFSSIVFDSANPAKSKPEEIIEFRATKEFIEKTFTLIAPLAKTVYITGDFNNWTTAENDKLIRRESGMWERKFLLKKGVHRYKFIVDGLWQPDPNNPRVEKNGSGNFDSVLEIK